jgi:hypothetical protein
MVRFEVEMALVSNFVRLKPRQINWMSSTGHVRKVERSSYAADFPAPRLRLNINNEVPR